MEKLNVGEVEFTLADVKVGTPIVLASDNAGFDHKEAVKTYLDNAGVPYIDCNSEKGIAKNYPEWSHKAAQHIMDGSAKSAILICGTGIGIGVAAMKCPGVYGVRCDCPEQARIARETLDVNMLSFGQRVTGVALAMDMVHEFLCTPYDEKNGCRDAIRNAEKKYMKEV